MTPRWSVQEDLDNGKVQELTIKPKVRVTQNKNLAIYLLYQKQQYAVPKVKVAVDFLVSRIQSP
jgi:DNA-binding transcriptional LysR family regulator